MRQTQPAAAAAPDAPDATDVPVEPVNRPPRTVTFDDSDDLDVPDFLK